MESENTVNISSFLIRAENTYNILNFYKRELGEESKSNRAYYNIRDLNLGNNDFVQFSSIAIDTIHTTCPNYTPEERDHLIAQVIAAYGARQIIEKDKDMYANLADKYSQEVADAVEDGNTLFKARTLNERDDLISDSLVLQVVKLVAFVRGLSVKSFSLKVIFGTEDPQNPEKAEEGRKKAEQCYYYLLKTYQDEKEKGIFAKLNNELPKMAQSLVFLREENQRQLKEIFAPETPTAVKPAEDHKKHPVFEKGIHQ